VATKPHELLHRLFEYIEEQLKQPSPKEFVIAKLPAPRYFQSDLAALPGVSFDVSLQGDYVWLLEVLSPTEIRLQSSGHPAPDALKPIIEES
jgi:hypothetical protein